MMIRSGLRCLFTIVAVVALVAPTSASELRGEITFLNQKGTQDVTEKVMVEFALSNTAANDVWILRYETPLRGFERDLLRVECDGQVVPYLGRVVMRLGPAQGDWIRIAAGASVRARFNLSATYDMHLPGTYTVEYRAYQHVMPADGPQSPTVIELSKQGQFSEVQLPVDPQTVTSDQAWIELRGEPSEATGSEALMLDIVDPDSSEAKLAEANSFIGCSSSRSSILNSAKTSGRYQASDAYAYLYYNGSDWFYDRWFGTHSSSLFSTVYDNFARTYTALRYYDYTFDCTCTEGGGVIAYIYPTIPFKVWACPTFWNLGSADRAAAIVHETTHWHNVAGTDDHTYGYSNCRWLADSYPSYAVNNADNYRFAAQYAP